MASNVQWLAGYWVIVNRLLNAVLPTVRNGGFIYGCDKLFLKIKYNLLSLMKCKDNAFTMQCVVIWGWCVERVNFCFNGFFSLLCDPSWYNTIQNILRVIYGKRIRGTRNSWTSWINREPWSVKVRPWPLAHMLCCLVHAYVIVISFFFHDRFIVVCWFVSCLTRYTSMYNHHPHRGDHDTKYVIHSLSCVTCSFRSAIDLAMALYLCCSLSLEWPICVHYSLK